MNSYEEFVSSYARGVIAKHGGVRAAARATGVDAAILSKMSSGKLVPSKKTFGKWFSECSEDLVDLEYTDNVYHVYCYGLGEFKDFLNMFGYKLEIVKKEEQK